MNKKWSMAGALLAALLVAAQAVEADVVYTDRVLITGSESLQVFEMPFDAPGSYRITATDLRWPTAELAALSFGAFTATESLATRSGAGTLEFFMAGPGRVFLQLYARTAGPEYAGLVAIQGESVAVVPLPASLVLLLSALGAAALPSLGRRARELIGEPEPMPTAV
jgi:hypothetical protein